MIRDVLLTFASSEAGSGPSVHITPDKVFQLGSLEITNSIFYGWITSIVIILLMIIVARRMTLKPKGGITQLVEVGTTFIMKLMESSLGSRALAVKYAPFFVSTFFFILVTNWLGLIPGVGEAISVDGVPLTRPFTADLNGTLAIATVMIVLVQAFAIRESGLKKHLRHYFNGSLFNPLTWFLGIFEMFSELTRIASLALRLFLNVAIGEVIIAIFKFLGGYAAPITSLPFLALELFVSALQAYIFVMLCVMYLAAAIRHDHDVEEHIQREDEAFA